MTKNQLTICLALNEDFLKSILPEIISLHTALKITTTLMNDPSSETTSIRFISIDEAKTNKPDLFIFDHLFQPAHLVPGDIGIYRNETNDHFELITPPIKSSHGKRQQALEIIAQYKDALQTRQPLCSIIIPNYNYGRFLENAIESVLKQTNNNIEFIILDNASTDNSNAILNQYKNDSRVSIILNESNIGPHKNFINGFNLARGKYICTLCADDYFTDGFVKQVIENIIKYDPDVIFTSLAYVDERGTPINSPRHPGYPGKSGPTNRNELLTLLTKDNYCPPSSTFWRISLLKAIGYGDTRFHGAGDWDLAVRVAQAGGRFAFIENPGVNYRLHEAQHTWRWGNSLEPLEDHCLLLEKVLQAGVPEQLKSNEAPVSNLLKARKSAYESIPENLAKRINVVLNILGQSESGVTPSFSPKEFLNQTPGPLFSIIITTYNRPRLLADALRSIDSQIFKDFEVILVNDCGEPVEHLLNQFNSVVTMIHHGQNRGLSAARNTGIAAARGKYIVYLDDDDLMLPNHLAVLADEIECHPDAIIYTDADYITETIEPNRRLEHGRSNPHRHGDFSVDQLMVSNFIPVNTFCHPRHIVVEIGNFDESLSSFEDWEFLLRLAKVRPFFHVTKTTVEVRNHATSGESRMLSRNLKNFPALYRNIYSKHPSENPITQKRRLRFLSSMDEGAQSNPPDKNNPNYFQRAYSNILEQRKIISSEINISSETEDHAAPKAISFHFLMYLEKGTEHKLADTLDSLNQQISANWQLDIVSAAPSPEGINEIPCLGWHTPSSLEEVKDTLDFIVQARKLDWIIELPAGAKCDPLFLWRIAHEIGNNAAAHAFFVDDDCFNILEEHFSPRFKPGVNQEALQSADLAGPLCVRRSTWLATDGASHRSGSTWFKKLQNVAIQFGWDSIKHTPDVLVSYPDKFPSDIESCLLDLAASLKTREIDGEIVPVSARSWTVRYPLVSTPLVSIAILSTGQLDLLSRCLSSLLEKTDYANLEIIIALSIQQETPDLVTWLKSLQQIEKRKIHVVHTGANNNHAARCNVAANISSGNFLLLLKEDSVIIQEKWIEELVRAGLQSGVGGVSPRLIQPGSAMIENAGSVLGLNGFVGSPYQGKIKLGEDLGYLDSIHIARDVSTLPPACMLIRKESYYKAGCMDETELGDYLAETDLCLNLRKNGERLIYQPLSNLASSDISESNFESDQSQIAARVALEARAKAAFSQRWFPEGAIDTYWNLNLSLSETIPLPEIELIPRWQFVPSADLPRIFAHPIPNGQGDFRVTSPLRALSRAGLVSECICLQRSEGKQRIISSAEILRLNPDSVIVQNYIHNSPLATLQDWSASGSRPFTVYALDDLITDMDPSNPFRKDIPANARARLQYALKRCDRLVVSTDYLADAYRGFATDIRVVPNRLEQAPWLPLRSQRRTSIRPRVGWAGGSTHHGDLVLLKGIIEQTRDQADWIFFGMCPDEIRPLLAEYHAQVPFSEYPAYLASLNLDIAVAPLAQTSFNRGKSNLRLLDYGILGIPVIATDIEPYQNSPACLVNNSVEAWTEVIRARIHDPEAREREGDAMRRWVLGDYLLENHLETWLEAHLP